MTVQALPYPVVMVAFGTAPEARATYDRLDRHLRHRFPATEIRWSYSAKNLAHPPDGPDQVPIHSPGALLDRLAAEGRTRVVVQPLQLFPGTEFHNIVRLTAKSPIACRVGMPLLTTPQDYDEVGELLRPIIAARPETTILVIGHGTAHPSWTAYPSLEKFLRARFGDEIHVGVVEKFPDSSQLVDQLAARGCRRVCLVPLFFVAGMHYRRDLIGEQASSWRARLLRRGMTVEWIDHGLGLYPGIEHLVIRHILEAQEL